jgi:hypothetical protein
MEVNRHRDAIRFSNGHESLLQNLLEGLRVKVVSLGADPAAAFEHDAAVHRTASVFE